MANGAAATAVDLLGRFNGFVARILRDAAAALIAVMTGIVLVAVFFRYVLGDSLTWTEDSSILAMIWVAFLIAPWSYRHGGNVSIDMAVDLLPEAARRLLRIAVNLLVLWLLYRFIVEALIYVNRGWTMRANAIPVPIAWFRAIVPVSLALMIPVGVELILRDALSILDRTRSYDVPQVAGAVEPE